MVVRNRKCSVDLTHVRPGERASLHTHKLRYELFHFLDDGALLEVFRPRAHDEYLIEPGQRHRFWAEDADFRMLVVTGCFYRSEERATAAFTDIVMRQTRGARVFGHVFHATSIPPCFQCGEGNECKVGGLWRMSFAEKTHLPGVMAEIGLWESRHARSTELK